MRYEDASQAAADHNAPVARPDVDVLPAGSYGPATGNALTGQGTTTGASGADSSAGPATIVAVQGAGGQGVMANGAYQVSGQYGALSIDTHGNFNYVRNPGTPDGVRDVFQYTLADASGTNASTTLTIDIAQVAAAAAGQTMVALPAGVELSDIHVNGRDLVINMPDGTQMVIPNGAVFVPQLSIGDVQVPASNVAALLIDSEPQPAAGAPQSSGGNFATDVPPLDPGVPLGDLIPPTEFGFTPPQFEELAQAVDRKPTVIIETPDNPAGAIDASESVSEKGLPARNGNEPAGSGEIADGNGTNDSDSSETNSGTIVFTAKDGLDSVAINGTNVTAVGQHIAGQFGTITITGIDLANGHITYSYTLGDNTSGDATQDVFTVAVTDDDGDVANASLTVHIVDDVPTARNDTDSTDKATHIATGNVMTGADTTSGTAGADTVGADNATVTAVSGAGGSDNAFDANGNLEVQGQFGTLTIKADGSYTYHGGAGAVGGSVDTFTYTLTDGDGDTSQATLTITNPDQTPTVVIQTPDNPAGAVNATESVFEKGLPARNGEPAGSGEIADGNGTNNSDASETNTGTIVLSSPDGVGSVTINGTAVTGVGQHIAGASGTLTIISYDLATGHIGYSYTLTDNTSGDATHDDFSVVVTDTDGDTATGSLRVNIVDDAPTARNDSDSVDLVTHLATGNVITGADTAGPATGADTVGADNATISAVQGAGGSDSSFDASGNLEVQGQFGTLTIKADGSYVYTLNAGAPGGSVDTFTYTLKDGDGDTSQATLTINNPDHAPTIVIQTPDNPAGAVNATESVFEKGLPARNGGEPAGSGEIADGNGTNNSDSSETNVGTIVLSSQDGIQSVTINGTAVTGVNQHIAGASGTITITSIDLATGHIGYSYTLTDNTSGDSTHDDFSVVITDNDGDTATATLRVNIVDDVPTAHDDTDAVTEDTSSVATGNVITGVGSDGNAAGGDVVGADNAVVTLVDGLNPGIGQATATAGGVSITGQYGTLLIHSDGSYTYTLNNANGDVNALGVGEHLTESFRYTLHDGDGDESNAVLTITINGTNDAPVAVADTNWTVEGGGAVVGNVLQSLSHPGDPSPALSFADVADTDVDGDTLTVTQVNNGSIANPIAGAHGTLTINANGSYSYQVNNADPAVVGLGLNQTITDTFTYAVSDGHGGTASATLTITIFGTNDAPTAVPDTNWALEDGGPISGNVIAGMAHPGDPSPVVDFADAADSDPNNDPLTVTDVNGNAANVGSDLVGTHGTLHLNSNGTYTYQVNNSDAVVQALSVGQTTTDSFTYSISDGNGGSASATLTITIFGTNDAPAAVADTNWSQEDVALSATGNVLQNLNHPGAPSGSFADHADTDPDAGDTLTVAAVGGSAANVGNALAGAHGSVTLNANGTYTYNLNNTDPAVQALGVGATITDTFTYTVSDGHGGTAGATLTITIFGTNDAPTAVADTNWTQEETALSATGNVLQNLNHPGAPAGAFADHADTDPDAGDVLNVATVGGSASNVGNALAGAHGSVTLNANGTYTYNLNNADPAVQALGVGATTTDTFSYTVSDGHGGTASATLTITIFGTNDTPTAVADTNWTVEDSATAATGNVLQNLAHNGAPAGSFADHADNDPDAGDTLTVTAINGNSANVGSDLTGAHGTLHLNSNGSYTYQVNNADPAVQALGAGATTTDTFNYTVSDGHGGTASATLTITIFGQNDAPQAVADTNWTVEDSVTAATGNVLQNVAHNGAPAGSFADHADSDRDAGDTLTVTAVNGNGANVGTDLTGTHGTLHLNSNGTYTYQVNNADGAVQALGAGNTLTDSFTYTVSDGHGGTDSSTLTITIFGANDGPSIAASTAHVSEEGLAGGIADGSGYPTNAADTTNLAQVLNGHVNVSDPDGDPLTVTLSNPPAGITVQSQPVSWTVSPDGHTMTATVVLNAVVTPVMTITIDNGGNYTVNLQHAIDHPVAGVSGVGAGGEDSINFNIQLNVSDGTTSNTSTLTIFVEDDSPTATPTLLTGTVDEDGVIEGIANGGPGDGITGGPSDVVLPPPETVTTGSVAGLFNSGADVPLTYSLSNNFAGLLGQGLTSQGVALSYSVNVAAGVYTLTASAPGGNTVFTFTLDSATGGYTFTLVDQLDHPTLDGLVGDNTENNLAIQLGSIIRATDADGDSAIAASGANSGLIITVNDDTPLAVNDAATVTVTLDNLGVENIIAAWTNIVMTSGGAPTGSDKDGDGAIDEIRWGNPSGSEQSGYGFVDNPDLQTETVLTNQLFSLGTFTHFNQPITGSELDKVTLEVNFTAIINGQTVNVGPIDVDFDHDETPNNGTPDQNRDIIDISAPATVVVINGVSYTLHIVGLVDEHGNVVTEVKTLEGQSNSYSLMVEFVNTATFQAAGNVLNNDGTGADEPLLVVATSGFNGSTDSTPDANGDLQVLGKYGTLTINAHGGYVYTLTADPTTVPNGFVEHFTYSANDFDGDGTTANLDVTINIDQAPVVQNATASVDDDGLTGGNAASTTGDLNANSGEAAPVNPSEAIFHGQFVATAVNGPVSYSLANMDGATGIVGTETVTYSWNSGTNVLTAEVTGGTRNGTDLFTVTVSPSTGSFTVTLLDNVLHAAGANENDATTVLHFGATDADGDTSFGNLTITFDDDAPTLGTVQNQQTDNLVADNDPVLKDATGTLHFTPGADGAGSAMTITANLAGMTSGGRAIVTHQIGNVLTAYQDVGPGGFDAGDTTVVFTLTVNPTAGTSGQYVFDLVTPIDATVVDTPVGGSTSFGAGPQPYQVVSATNVSTDPLAILTGWHTNGSFDVTNWYNGTNQLPAGVTIANINGSTAGWGVDSNNFTAGQFIRWDFGEPPDDFDGPGGYNPPNPAVDLPKISTATFELLKYSSSDHFQWVVHFTDGTTASFSNNGSVGQFTYSAPAGKFIDWVDTYTPDAGAGKIDIVSVGVSSSSTDKTIPFTLQLSDGDGDPTSTANFSIHIKDGLTPFAPAAPVVLDLNGDGVHFVGTSAGVTYDYGHGAVATAWASPQDAILVHDANHNGNVDSASEFVFAGVGQTDLQGLAVYDTNHDGQLTAADADFSSFAVWQDANSNGKVDAGELSSLTARGIVSVSLSSDGIAYTSAGGDVEVAGTGSFTWSNGVKGTLADAAFVTTARSFGDETRSPSASASNLTLIAALAAAGLSSASASYAESHASFQGDALPLAGSFGHEAFTTTVAATGSSYHGFDASSMLGTWLPHDVARGEVSMPTAHNEIVSRQALTTNDVKGPAFAELLQGSHGASHADAHAGTPVTAMAVAMPSAAQLVAAGSAATTGHGQTVAGPNALQHNEVVSKVLADSLNGGEGHGPNVEALVNQLGGHGSGHSALEALASQAGGAGSFGHMGLAIAFGGMHGMGMEMMHQDAAPAHG